MFVHFKTGEVLPINWGGGLFPFVFDQYVVGPRMNEGRNPEITFKLVQRRLEDHKRHGRAFLLPDVIAYPDRSIFQPLPYADYPNVNDLIEVSDWDMKVLISPNHYFEIIDAKKVGSLLSEVNHE